MLKTVAACTLGCKVNQYDTEAMLGLFAEKGYEVVDFPAKADIYIVNTCTVTNLGSKKSRQMIRKARGLNPKAIVVAAGCYAQVSPEEVAAINGVNMVLGTKERGDVVAEVEAYATTRPPVGRAFGHSLYRNVDDVMDETEFENLSVSKPSGRTRAFLKVQEGCDRFCAYCIIPYARGPVRSRRTADILAEAEALSKSGFKEIVLAGIHVASYGKDLVDKEGGSLTSLIERVHDIEGIERIRLSSVEPTVIDEPFIETIGRLPKVCDHFHLSLQSGCDNTLKRMNRRYGAADYAQAAGLLRRTFPRLSLTTDVMVGFPGETDADFAESIDFIRQMAFAKIHVFPFSPKAGTPAAAFPNQVPQAVKQARARETAALDKVLSARFAASLTGLTLPVLYETEVCPGVYEGHTTNYVKVTAMAKTVLTGLIAPTRLAAPQAEGDGLRGFVI